MILLAGFAAALVVPVGYALSLESLSHTPTVARAAAADTALSSAVVGSPVMVRATPVAVPDSAPAATASMPDAGKLLLLGTMLFGLSALVRKAI